MFEYDKQEFARTLRLTLSLYGNDSKNPELLAFWFSLLKYHSIESVSKALAIHAAKSKFSPKPADILEIIDRVNPDGRPGADEAWAMIPRDEYTSAVMTEEIAEAYGIAKPLLDDGDQVAARMAFKEAYVRIVGKNKLAGIAPKWFPSLGRDLAIRETVINEAVRLGRLGFEHAAKSVPAIADRVQSQRLSIEDKAPVSHTKALENLAKIRQMLGGSRLAGGQA